ncbi:MAG: helix-turn-helix transcriptional regulator, partial [Lentisphaerae bacterium]|nr:helix-turn-helix transcriptional regulator [Lentisphaerota bacterium]
MLTLINLKNMKRAANFPFPVESVGQVHFFQTVPNDDRYTRLEVTLRLSAEEDQAHDEVDGKLITTPYPHAVFKMPGHHHSFHAADRREALFFIYSKAVSQRLKTLDFLPEEMIQPIALTGALKQLIRRLSALMAVSETIGSADRIDLVCFAILEELLFQRKIESDAMQSRIRKIASMIRMDAENQPDIAGIAAENGFSERSFYRQWKKVFPLSPAQYVMEEKMKRAAWLLTRSHLRIGEIAAMLHFCDDNNFSSAFKKHHGMTPREYR